MPDAPHFTPLARTGAWCYRLFTQLWFARLLAGAVRMHCRLLEWTSKGSRREQCRAFRERMDAQMAAIDVLLRVVDRGTPAERTAAMDDFLERYGDPRIRDRMAEFGARMGEMQREAEELQAIEAGEDSTAAAEALRAYLEAHPESYLGYVALARALKQAGDLDGALQAYAEAIRLARDGTAYKVIYQVELGILLQERGELDAAVAEYRRIIDGTAPTNPVVCLAYFHLGNALEQSGDRRGARQAWREAMKRDRTGTIAPRAREALRTQRG